MFDLNILSLHYVSGHEWTQLPGLLALAAPRRAARGRGDDQLVLLLDLVGGMELPSRSLERAAQAYYRNSGSVTAALRAAVDDLNNELLEHNLRKSGSGEQMLGLLNLAVVHTGRLILAQSGPTHAFILAAAGSQHLYDPQLAGRGLGLSRTVNVRFFQSELAPGDALVLCSNPPAAWTVNGGLVGAPGEALDTLRRRLLSQSQPDLKAAVVQFQAGNGKINLVSSAAGSQPSAPEAGQRLNGAQPLHAMDTPAQVAPDLTSQVEPPVTVEPAIDAPQPPQIPPLQAAPEISAIPAEPARVTARAVPAAKSTVVDESEPLPAPRRRQRTGAPPFLRSLAAIFRWGSRAQAGGEERLGRAFSRVLPGSADSSHALSPATMVFIAVAVPVVVVAVAMAVYFQRGRADQYRAYYAQAVVQASQAETLKDPAALRGAWEKTLFWLDKADTYQKTSDSRALRLQAQSALDGLDNIVRLGYQPAIIGGLAASVRVTRMVATNNDLYMLDATQGRVLRAVLTGHGFEFDPNFACGPGTSGSIIINKIVDISPMPPDNEFNATVMAIDEDGDLLYCTPGSGFTAAPLAPPDNNWGKITAMVLDSNSLYVLDPQTNAVWVYDGGVGNFSDRPRLIFDTDIPPMADVIDLAVSNQNLYLLHADGHITQCTFSSLAFEPTRCTDPAPYTDNRPGRGGKVTTFSDARFTQVMSTALPTPALYMLDPQTQAIYLFSLQLRLQNQYRADTTTDTRLPSDRPATAFTIGPNRLVFLAFDNQIYYAVSQ